MAPGSCSPYVVEHSCTSAERGLAPASRAHAIDAGHPSTGQRGVGLKVQLHFSAWHSQAVVGPLAAPPSIFSPHPEPCLYVNCGKSVPARLGSLLFPQAIIKGTNRLCDSRILWKSDIHVNVIWLSGGWVWITLLLRGNFTCFLLSLLLLLGKEQQ